MDVVLWYTVMVADEIRQYFTLLSRRRGRIKRINCLNTEFRQKIYNSCHVEICYVLFILIVGLIVLLKLNGRRNVSNKIYII